MVGSSKLVEDLTTSNQPLQNILLDFVIMIYESVIKQLWIFLMQNTQLKNQCQLKKKDFICFNFFYFHFSFSQFFGL